MNRNILWIFLLTAPLVSASSLGYFDATCTDAGCGGIFTNGSVSFTFDTHPDSGFSQRYALATDHHP